MRLFGQRQVYLVKLAHLVIVVCLDIQVYRVTAAQVAFLDTLEQAVTAVVAAFQALAATLALAHQDILV